MTLPTTPQIKKFIANALWVASDSVVDDVDTVFHEGADGEVTFFGTTEDGTEFEVILTIQDINEVPS